jgi:hypothetical protein
VSRWFLDEKGIEKVVINHSSGIRRMTVGGIHLVPANGTGLSKKSDRFLQSNGHFASTLGMWQPPIVGDAAPRRGFRSW